ncbi:MAG TPA: helix-turn-helix domain-containing protein [Candidatus Gastranaerophilales bacterium]|nr:helix-turn-helix domain-containing protein [Candidatus Gastranaerophilales bacterium]
MQNLTGAAKNNFTQFELSKLLITSHFFSKNKMSPSARLVLIVLCSHYPNVYPSIKTIQNESGIASKTSVINSLKELSKAGFVLYETKNVNHYTFTSYFFEILKVGPGGYRDCSGGGTKIGHKQINKNINNKFEKKLNFLEKRGKEPKDYKNTYLTGINYPKWQKPIKHEKSSPLDLNEEQAISFLEKLPKSMHNTYFALELKKKWKI